VINKYNISIKKQRLIIGTPHVPTCGRLVAEGRARPLHYAKCAAGEASRRAWGGQPATAKSASRK